LKKVGENLMQEKALDQRASPDTNSVPIEVEHIPAISGLADEHLLEVLPLLEEAAQRLGSSSATNTWLLTPVSPGGKKPIEYLSTRQYNTFRGFLLHIRTGQEMFRPLTPSKLVYRERPREDIEDELERLRPRAWIDEDDEDIPQVDR